MVRKLSQQQTLEQDLVELESSIGGRGILIEPGVEQADRQTPKPEVGTEAVPPSEDVVDVLGLIGGYALLAEPKQACSRLESLRHPKASFRCSQT